MNAKSICISGSSGTNSKNALEMDEDESEQKPKKNFT